MSSGDAPKHGVTPCEGGFQCQSCSIAGIGFRPRCKVGCLRVHTEVGFCEDMVRVAKFVHDSTTAARGNFLLAAFPGYLGTVGRGLCMMHVTWGDRIRGRGFTLEFSATRPTMAIINGRNIDPIALGGVLGPWHSNGDRKKQAGRDRGQCHIGHRISHS